jgi:Glucan phosphorylase
VWRPDETIEAVAYDTPIVGWRGRHVNPLRLWTARAVDPMRLDAFNSGDHIGALVEQSRAEAISKILYPSDETPAGPGIAPAAGIFLRVGLAAGPGATALAHRW